MCSLLKDSKITYYFQVNLLQLDKQKQVCSLQDSDQEKWYFSVALLAINGAIRLINVSDNEQLYPLTNGRALKYSLKVVYFIKI